MDQWNNYKLNNDLDVYSYQKGKRRTERKTDSMHKSSFPSRHFVYTSLFFIIFLSVLLVGSITVVYALGYDIGDIIKQKATEQYLEAEADISVQSQIKFRGKQVNVSLEFEGVDGDDLIYIFEELRYGT